MSDIEEVEDLEVEDIREMPAPQVQVHTLTSSPSTLDPVIAARIAHARGRQEAPADRGKAIPEAAIENTPMMTFRGEEYQPPVPSEPSSRAPPPPPSAAPAPAPTMVYATLHDDGVGGAAVAQARLPAPPGASASGAADPREEAMHSGGYNSGIGVDSDSDDDSVPTIECDASPVARKAPPPEDEAYRAPPTPDEAAGPPQPPTPQSQSPSQPPQPPTPPQPPRVSAPITRPPLQPRRSGLTSELQGRLFEAAAKGKM
eukprot:2201838-Prymnesium_polylepis.1